MCTSIQYHNLPSTDYSSFHFFFLLPFSPLESVGTGGQRETQGAWETSACPSQVIHFCVRKRHYGLQMFALRWFMALSGVCKLDMAGYCSEGRLYRLAYKWWSMEGGGLGRRGWSISFVLYPGWSLLALWSWIILMFIYGIYCVVSVQLSVLWTTSKLLAMHCPQETHIHEWDNCPTDCQLQS